MHPIKEMLRWPVNQIVDAYIKEMATTHGNNDQGYDDEEYQLID